ncbi:hypothetical protein HanIR_Chr12g0613311 [Helianthus annuus]|nr:hypothetical protein HanIR_Chr12g0613311 [Helianthus annuus]
MPQLQVSQLDSRDHLAYIGRATQSGNYATPNAYNQCYQAFPETRALLHALGTTVEHHTRLVSANIFCYTVSPHYGKTDTNIPA